MQRLRGWALATVPAGDFALAVALAAIAGAEAVVRAETAPRLQAALAVVTALALLVRTRLPVTACVWAAAGLLVQTLAFGSTQATGVLLAIVVLAYSAFAHAPPVRALVGVGVLGAVTATSVALDPSDSAGDVVATVLLFFLLPGGLGWSVRRRTTRIEALESERAALAHEAATAAHDERRRIARELHDVVSHAVTLIAVQAEAGQAVLADDDTRARRTFGAIADASRDALTELHRMMGVLEDPAAPGGLARLPGLVEGARAAGLDVRVTTTGAPRPLAPAADHAVLRVVQEGVTNALRHADGTVLSITLDYTDGALVVRVASSGHRERRSAYGGAGRGLAGLRERVETLGGHLDSGPTTDGFLLVARVPDQVGSDR